MAQPLALLSLLKHLLSLLKKLMSRELSSFSSIGLNNFVFCILFLLSGSMESGKLKDAFWSTLLFQLVLLAPLLVTFSVDTQHRFPSQRVASWPLTDTQRLLLSSISFVMNPLFLVLLAGLFLWMGLAIAFVFVLVGLVVHGTVFAIGRLSIPAMRSIEFIKSIRLLGPRKTEKLGFSGGKIMQAMWRELTGTLDFWVALLIAFSGTLYRVFGRSTEPAAFPILALFVGIAMGTVAQRMFSLDEGRSLLRYRLLPVSGWKLLLMQDATFLIPLLIMVALLSFRTGLAFGLVALAVGRYPSLRQRIDQRRWRFVGGDPRFGVAQVLLGGMAGIGAERSGLWVVAVAFLLYAGSVFGGDLLWRRSSLP